MMLYLAIQSDLKITYSVSRNQMLKTTQYCDFIFIFLSHLYCKILIQFLTIMLLLAKILLNQIL